MVEASRRRGSGVPWWLLSCLGASLLAGVDGFVAPCGLSRQPLCQRSWGAEAGPSKWRGGQGCGGQEGRTMADAGRIFVAATRMQAQPNGPSSDEMPKRLGSMSLEREMVQSRSAIDRSIPTSQDAVHQLVAELTTDDGYPVSILDDNTRPDWVSELLTTFNSRVLVRIADRMGLTIAWSIYVTVIFWWAETLAPEDLGLVMQFTIPGWPHELVGGFLSILLVFRTDQAYDRFWEGRKLWADVYSRCRSLARLTLSNLDGYVAEMTMAHIAAFPISLKQHLRGSRNAAEIAAIFNTYLPPNSTVIDVVTRSNNMPVTMLLSMSQACSPLRSAPRYTNLDVVWEEIEGHVRALQDIVSECEKIKCTPLPLSYNRHASRFFSVFTLTLPFALIKETSPVLVPAITAFVAWILFVTEEIGHTIEDPFGKGLVTDPDDVAVSHTSGISEAQMLDMFRKMDKGNKGEVDFETLQMALKDMAGADLNPGEAQQVMARLDLNGDGMIDYEEFKQSWAFTTGGRMYEIKQLETLPLGQYCDTIQSEVLYHWRLKQLEEANRLKDRKGKESPSEPLHDESAGASDTSAAHGGGSIEGQLLKGAGEDSEARELFKRIDLDGSGGISRSEFKAAASGMSGFTSGQSSDDAFDSVDQNQDGVIDWVEFKMAWSVNDVKNWLISVGQRELTENFQANDVNGKVLMGLTREDLEVMGIEKDRSDVLMKQVEFLRNGRDPRKKQGRILRKVRGLFKKPSAGDENARA